MKNLAKAIIAVMQEVKGIEKSMTIGTGNSSYKGVPDQEVKKIIGEAMAKNGLCILPIGINAKTQVDRWEETTQYGNAAPIVKMKQSVFTEATCEYLLLHESGESQVVQGYGHGIDSQDKGAGKSTTYALKYTLLYLFLVPTGKIDDADNTHSDDHQIPTVNTPPPAPSKPVQLPILIKGTDKWNKIVEGLADGLATIEKVRLKNEVSAGLEKELNVAVQDLQAKRVLAK